MNQTTTAPSPLHQMAQLGRWRASPGAWTGYFALLNATYLLWLGCLKLVPAERTDVLKWWHASALWEGLRHAWPVFPTDELVLAVAMATELLAALCLLGRRHRLALRWGALLASFVYGFNLLYLLTNPVWVATMGGFPFLGSGQGYLKYVPMLATSLYLLAQGARRQPRMESIAARVGWIGILLVMGWIGSMKFFLFEAQGIEPLLRHHWIFGWMYGVWDVQQVSNIIGLTELVFALLILLGAVWPVLLPSALVGIAVTVACTTSFMFTLPGWAPDAYFPLLNGAGVFLLKDQFLLAATLMLFSLRPRGSGAATEGPAPRHC